MPAMIAAAEARILLKAKGRQGYQLAVLASTGSDPSPEVFARPSLDRGDLFLFGSCVRCFGRYSGDEIQHRISFLLFFFFSC